MQTPQSTDTLLFSPLPSQWQSMNGSGVVITRYAGYAKSERHKAEPNTIALLQMEAVLDLEAVGHVTDSALNAHVVMHSKQRLMRS